MKEDEFRKDHATRMAEALTFVQDKIDQYEKTDKDYEIVKYIYSSLEEFTQLRARFEQLNKGFSDPETGELIQDCTPYAMERLKHNLAHYMSKTTELEKRIDPKRIKALQMEYDTSRGLFCIDRDPKEVSKEWIEQNAFQLELNKDI